MPALLLTVAIFSSTSSGAYWQQLPVALDTAQQNWYTTAANQENWYKTAADLETWYAEAKKQQLSRPAPPQRVLKSNTPRSHKPSPDSAYSSGRCGGNLPPCWVMNRESGGNIYAYNATGCGGRGCSGKWQCDPRSCNGTGTEEEQDAEAARLWDGGAGCSNWAACG